MHLTLGSCTLRHWEPADLDSLVRNANNRAVSCHMRDRFPSPYTPADGERFLSMCMHMSPRTFLAIVVDNQAAGGIGIHLQEDVERVSAELGYWLGEPFWGRGIATSAVKGITEWAFASFPLTRLYAVPFATNPASARVLEKSGYTLEGRMRRSAIKDGRITDQLLYSCVR